jgi:hypothetical protein
MEMIMASSTVDILSSSETTITAIPINSWILILRSFEMPSAMPEKRKYSVVCQDKI